MNLRDRAIRSTKSFDAALARAARNPSRFGCPADMPDHACALTVESARTDGSFGDPLAKIVMVKRGVAGLNGEHGSWSIIHDHMVFVPAARPHVFIVLPNTEAVVVHLRQDRVAWTHEGCWVAPVSPLAREMLTYTARWGPERAAEDKVADAFFIAIARICPEWFSGGRILWTPFAKSPELRRAIAFAWTHLDAVSIDTAACAAHLSARTLRRRFQEELGISWREFIREVRMSRAIELLSREYRNVTQTAFAVGFHSLSAFTVAFTAYTGSPPSTFIARRAQMRGKAMRSSSYRHLKRRAPGA